MVAVMVARDPVADSFEEAERRLIEWGLSCRRESDRLGLPRISGIQQLIDHVRREDRLARGVRRRKLKTVEEREGKLTARGKQTRVARKPTPIVNSAVLEVDAVVAKLPGWMQATVIRRYLYGQPDRLACRDLKLPKEVYRMRCNAAIECVSVRLRNGKITRRNNE
jgi:DNA-directed RNA polymerase specialized sigma24 family protein